MAAHQAWRSVSLHLHAAMCRGEGGAASGLQACQADTYSVSNVPCSKRSSTDKPRQARKEMQTCMAERNSCLC